MKHLSTLVLVAGFALLVSASTVRACSCVPERPVCEAFGSVSAVFVGKVVGSAQQKTELGADGTIATFDVGKIYFAVEEAFSGVQGQKSVTIHSGTGGGDCGYWFVRGERYLVYAYGNPKDGLGTGICTRTRPVAHAVEDLEFLRRLPVKGTGVSIRGTVGEVGEPDEQNRGRKVKPLRGITVTITDKDGKQTELVTDENGSYEIAGLKPGEYEIRAALPEYYYKDDYSIRKVKVYDRGCARQDFAAFPNGRISGRIIDANGNPVKTAKIVLIKSDTEEPLSMGDEIASDYVRNEEGRFKLDRIPPGEYLLGLNITFSPDAEEPYPSTYYPGVRDRAQATRIKVGMGEKVTEYTLRLPPPARERKIEGVVMWPDGSPAIGAEVHLTDQNHPGWIANGTVKTNTAGLFSLTGYEGISYWVLASTYEPKQTHAEPPKISSDGPVSGLKLVLSSEGSLCEHYFKKPKDKQ
jgi:hypothetical protein